MAGLVTTESAADFKVLESAATELTVVAIPPCVAASIAISMPPIRREDTPIKLVFFVPSIASARATAALFGGELNSVPIADGSSGASLCVMGLP